MINYNPGFIKKFYEDIHKLSLDELNRIGRFGGLDIQDLTSFLTRPTDHTVDFPENVSSSYVIKHNQFTNDITSIGQQSLDSGETAIVVYISEHSVISCTQRLAMDMTLLGMKQIQSLGISNIWYVVPVSVYDEVRSHLSAMSHSDTVKIFKQFESVRLTPDNQLYTIDGAQQFYSCGPGDAISCFNEEGDLKAFIEKGGKYLYFVDMQNLLASPDPGILGHHIQSGSPITCEVISRLPHELGPVVCNFMGVNQVVERFRLSAETDDDFDMISTGSFVVRADLNFDSFRLPWHRMKRDVDGQLVLQYERFLSDITAFFKTTFIEVNKDDRYSPVKNFADLVRLEELFEFR
jgi:UTP--glucose-1-phosphate uridylyltransferase